ncbi:hypothetical protein GCM10018771_13660 [Streptomyces cellulosae]|nr:hypothetical protein GCM10018771_13660 [Streptomyces cellulosae]
MVQGPAHGNRPGAGRKYNRALRDLMAGEKATPSFIVSPELDLDEAPPPTNTSAPVTRAGRRWCCTPDGHSNGDRK